MRNIIMETEFKFRNAGEPWSEKEEKQLNKLYNEDKLNIMEISKIHCRAPGGILSRLKVLNIISHRQLARGYDVYKKSEFYKEAVQSNKEKYKSNLTKKLEQTENKPQTNNDNIDLKNNLEEIKNDLKSIKTEIKELVEMMKAVYEFEEV